LDSDSKMTTPANPLMTQAAGMFANPNAAAVPPAPQGVIDPMQHPVIKAIIQALSQGAQNYSMTAMDPRERLQRQEMDAQKAEALARLGISQQQLGLEGQRVGIEQQRATTEAKGVEQTGAYQRGELGIRGKEAAISQQRADQEHQDRIAEHELRSKQLEEDIRYHKAETQTAQGRLAVERQANALAGERIDMEKKHFEDQIALQGKQYTRQLAEDERKQLHSSLDAYYGAHPWIANLSLTGPGTIQQKHKDIDDYIDQKIGVSGGYSGRKPGQGVLAQPGQNAAPTVFERKPDGTIGPATQGKP
jgi:hypothetical protein